MVRRPTGACGGCGKTLTSSWVRTPSGPMHPTCVSSKEMRSVVDRMIAEAIAAGTHSEGCSIEPESNLQRQSRITSGFAYATK